MLKNAAIRGVLPLALGSLMLATLVACNGSSPNSPGGGGSGGYSGDPNAPHAAPGLGSNPGGSVASGAPAVAPSGSVTFSDPNNLPFVDPTSDQSRASNLFFAGNWTVNGGYLEQSTGARTASLSFREYVGDGFHTQGGAATAKYRTDVTAWVYQPSDQYANMVGAPLGIIGFAPYYRDETHYLLAVAKPDKLEVWAVDGFLPGTEWPVTNRLWSKPLASPLQVGAPVSWSVEIDTNAQAATIWANGEQQATVNSPLLTNSGQHVALVSNGNYLHFQDFKVYVE